MSDVVGEDVVSSDVPIAPLYAMNILFCAEVVWFESVRESVTVILNIRSLLILYRECPFVLSVLFCE